MNSTEPSNPSAQPLALYLDQNMWIQVARIAHGKVRSAEARALFTTLEQAVDDGRWVLPLSAVHYIELARVSNVERRHRLGTVMFDLSRGITLASTRLIIQHEIEVSLARRYSSVEVRPFKLLGFGVGHAFGITLPPTWSGADGPRLERAVLAGDAEWGVTSPPFRGDEHRKNFHRHLEHMKETRTLPVADWASALSAITMIDILDPMNEILIRNGIHKESLLVGGPAGVTALLREMPSRRVDLHLHRQVLKDPTYRPKLSDLEDWSGLTMATAYCDVVACEKHMAAMLTRDRFQERARVERSLEVAVRVAQSLLPARR